MDPSSILGASTTLKKEKKVQFTRLITFDTNVKPWILKTFGYRVGPNKFIYEGNKKALASDGKPIRLAEFAGFTRGKRKGEVILHRSDITGIMEIADQL